jgi:hypothetical protein
MKSILKHGKENQKKRPLPEQIVKWDSAVKYEEHNARVPGRKDLKEAIKQADLVKLNFILDHMNPERTATLLTENDGRWMKYCFYFLNKKIHDGKNYDRDLFQEILAKFIRLNKAITSLVFVGLRISLRIGSEEGYNDLEQSLIDDYDIAENLASTDHAQAPEISDSDDHRESTSSDERQAVSVTADANYLPLSSKVDSSQHAILTEESKTTKEQIMEKNQVEKSNTDSNQAIEGYNLVLSPFEILYNWVYELPEWLQEQILNSTPIRSLFEEAEKTAAIHDSKYIQNQIEKIFIAETTNKSEDITVDKQSEKVTFAELPSQDLVDTSMILENSQITGLILPIVDIGSGNIFGENEFGGFANFNGLNGLELF